MPEEATKSDDPLSRLRIDRDGLAARRRVPWKGIVLAVLLLGIGGMVVSSNLEAWTAPRVRIGRVQRIGATEGAVATTANGYVVARRRAAISSKLSGRLEEMLVDVGDRVAEGQILGRLGHADLDAAVAMAKADIEARKKSRAAAEADRDAATAAVAAAEAQLPRSQAQIDESQARVADAARQVAMQEKLLASGAGGRDALDSARTHAAVMAEQAEMSRASLEQMRSEVARARKQADAAAAHAAASASMVAVAEAALAQAEALRRDADIVAPFAGIVVRKEAEVGEMVSPVNAAGSTTRGAVVSLVDFGSLEMEVDVIERDIAKVGDAAVCRIVLDGRRESPYVGKVRQKVPTADRTTSTIKVKVTFEKLDSHVLPEMGGRVEFLLDGKAQQATAKDRVLAPEAAFTTHDGKSGVWIVESGRLRFAEAAKGAPAAGESGTVEVASGLAGGEDVVLSPGPALKPGKLVRAGE
ncbi:MAG: Multidrug resistance protein MdtA [Planctomycetes bacterium]|nr:Multidrug resistance protein MdtA [Planctomycetota bacterium]